MNLGAILPNSGALASRPGLAAMARAAESAGAASVWVSDHLVMPGRPVTDYPFSGDGRPTWKADTDWYEALACCAYLAAVTSTCRIGTAVLILPQRNVLHLAKETSTIDQLSGGRLELGVGVGWSEAEMTALGYDYHSRGGRFEEMLAALRACWTGRTSAVHGRHLDLEDGLLMYPVPVTTAGPPLLVGGMSPVAIRRAATIGDGWLAIAFTDDWDDAGLEGGLSRLQEHSLRAGHEESPRAVLKLHCRDDAYELLDQFVLRARDLGFGELIIDLPWSRGTDAAASTLSRVAALVRA